MKGSTKCREPLPPASDPGAMARDHDVDLKAVFMLTGSLVGITVAIMALVWGLSVYLKESLVASDPAPSPIPEANASRLPPEPRLEDAPPANLAELRAREDAILTGWEWTDKEHGRARIPIDRALEILAEKGLPAPAPPEEGKK